jgi:hypothetical protein
MRDSGKEKLKEGVDLQDKVVDGKIIGKCIS